MSCERYQKWLSAEVDGELAGWRAALLRSHLGRCAACAKDKAEMLQLRQLVSSQREAYVSKLDNDLFWQRLHAGIARAERTHERAGVTFFGSFSTRWLGAGAVAVAAAAVLCIGVFFNHRSESHNMAAAVSDLPLLSPPGEGRVEVAEVKTPLKSWAGVVRFDKPDVDITVIWVSGMDSVKDK